MSAAVIAVRKWILPVLFALEAAWIAAVGPLLLAFGKSSAEFDGESVSTTFLVGAVVAIGLVCLILGVATAVGAGGLRRIPPGFRVAVLIAAGLLNLVAGLDFGREAADLLARPEYWRSLGFETQDLIWSMAAVGAGLIGTIGSAALARREWMARSL